MEASRLQTTYYFEVKASRTIPPASVGWSTLSIPALRGLRGRVTPSLRLVSFDLLSHQLATSPKRDRILLLRMVHFHRYIVVDARPQNVRTLTFVFELFTSIRFSASIQEVTLTKTPSCGFMTHLTEIDHPLFMTAPPIH